MNDTELPGMSSDLSNSEKVLGFVRSEMFLKTFSDGMDMVEETAAYLDGRGREQSRLLPREGALAYAGESMRLTTRLMQVASWLLLQRGIREGEIPIEQALAPRNRIGAQDICRGAATPGKEHLPEELSDLLVRSERLYDRVERLDIALYGADAEENDSDEPVRSQQSRIEDAFSGLAFPT